MRTRAFFCSSSVVLWALSCSPGLTTDTSATGGSGGVPSSGGAAPVGSGGAPVATGGASGAGGAGSGGVGPAGTGGNATGGSAAGGSAAGGSAAGGSGGEPGPTEFVYDYGTTVENTGTDCVVPTLAEPDALPSMEQLPDPFTKLDGTVMSKKSDWRCRRQELRAQAEKYIYGQKPTPELVSGAVTENQVSVHVEDEGTSIDFAASIVLPEGEGPFPAIINVGGQGLSLGQPRVLDQGVAIIYYKHNEIGQEGTPEQSRGKPNAGKFYDIYGGDHSAGLLMAWAWGASRLIDVLQQSDGSVIDVGRLGVTGCSRNGKGAFAIGLFDERIALTIPHETSTGGVPVYRLVDILGQERTDHNYNGLNWLSNDFEPFIYANGVSNAVKLPIDTHELVAMIAPRGILVLDNMHEAQYGAPAGHLATAAGAEVFSALGVPGHVSYHSDVADTGHCVYKDAYTTLLTANIARFLKHEGEAPGEFVVGQGADGNLAEWKTWETPTLE